MRRGIKRLTPRPEGSPYTCTYTYVVILLVLSFSCHYVLGCISRWQVRRKLDMLKSWTQSKKDWVVSCPGCQSDKPYTGWFYLVFVFVWQLCVVMIVLKTTIRKYPVSMFNCIQTIKEYLILEDLLRQSTVFNNNNNNSNRIQRLYSRFFTISSQCRDLSPTRTLKWPRRNRVQITCNTLSAYHVQHVVLRATW